MMKPLSNVQCSTEKVLAQPEDGNQIYPDAQSSCVEGYSIGVSVALTSIQSSDLDKQVQLGIGKPCHPCDGLVAVSLLPALC